jgi:hypothetical protein
MGITGERAVHHRLLLLWIAHPLLLALMASGGEAPIQVIGCTNKSKMGEGLGEVAQVFAT